MNVVLLFLALAQSPGSCLARMAAHPAGESPTFATEQECELWEALILSEHDLRTATITVAALEAKLQVRAPIATESEVIPSWVWVLLGAATVAAGGLGFWLGREVAP